MDVYPQLACELGVLNPDSSVSRLLERLGRYTLNRSDGVIALGETMADKLHLLGASRVTTIHHWADGQAIRPCPMQGNELRAARGWNDRFVVLYSGNLGLVHEFDTLLGAADLLRDEPRFLFAFVGAGPRLAEVRQAAERRGLPNVEFHPHVRYSDLGRSLGAGDVHLVTLREGLAGLLVPSKIYGTLAAGRPTLYVGPPQGEIPRILREGRCGTLLGIGDSAGLAAAIRRYDAEETRRRDEGRRARQLFLRRFTKERGLRAHRRLVESLDSSNR